MAKAKTAAEKFLVKNATPYHKTDASDELDTEALEGRIKSLEERVSALEQEFSDLFSLYTMVEDEVGRQQIAPENEE